MAMQAFTDDDLDEVKPAPKAAQTATATATATAKPKAQAAEELDDETPKPKAAAADDDIHDTDFDDEKVYLRPGTLNRIRPDKGKAVRVAFVKAVKMKSAKSHFVEVGTGKEAKKGTYRCLIPVGSEERGYCCVKLDEDSDIHVAALVLVYKNADAVTGKYVASVDAQGNKVVPPVLWELGYVDLSGFNMKQIKKLPDEDQTPYDIDIIMTHAEGRAFGYEFNRASNKARWLHNPEIVKEVETAIERFKDGKTLIAKLGKKLNLIEWKALLSGVSGGDESKLDNMDEL